MAMTATTSQDEAISSINTTPLIDVLLVLLIMFIITIPLQTHSVKVDLPTAPPLQSRQILNPVKNSVVVTASSQILWNGTAIDLIRLRQYLDMTQSMSPVPELHLKPEPQAPYDMVDRVLAVTKRANVTNMGFVGNEAYREAF